MTLRQWKPGLIAAALLAAVTSIPQMYLCYERGSQWNGAFAYFDSDEFAYSAYLNALIDGRPRRNDPYTGDDGGQFETLYSIQFVPAYAIAIPARIFHISASAAFIALLPLASFTSCLILFLLFFELTKNSLVSAVGAIGVLCFGVLAAQAPWQFFSVPFPLPFPFLRRYMPAAPFPLFFLLALLVWRSIADNSILWSALAGVVMAAQIFSYFFLWTASAAWLATLVILWLVVRPYDHRLVVRVFGPIALFAGVAMVPYVWLLGIRYPALDQTQLLEFTHRPDMLRGPEIFGMVVILVVFKSKSFPWKNRETLFLLSFALAPFVVFNQQVLTGRSLQPFHYERFIANYWAFTSVFLAFGLKSEELPNRLPYHIAVCTLGIGLILAGHSAAERLGSNIEVDQGRAVAVSLRGTSGVAFITTSLTHTFGTTASNPILWSQYLYTFGRLDLAEQKRRFYQYLYYSGVKPETLRLSLQRGGYAASGEIFGLERSDEVLTARPQPITLSEIDMAVAEYRNFSLGFKHTDAESPLLAYAIVSPSDDLSNLNKWYSIDSGHSVGDLIIYRLTLK
jgi:hypothetical protein